MGNIEPTVRQPTIRNPLLSHLAKTLRNYKMPPAATTRSSIDSAKSRSEHDKERDGSLENDKAADAAPGSDGEENAAESAPFSPMREIAFVFVICMAQFLSLAGLAQSIAPLNIIGR